MKDLTINIPKPDTNEKKILLVLKLLNNFPKFNQLSDTDREVFSILINFYIKENIVLSNKILQTKLKIKNTIIANIKNKLKKLNFIIGETIPPNILDLINIKSITFTINES